jgi:hypothetical protein
MADPVSWLLIEPGWHVFGSDGSELGHIEEVTGDQGEDIFDGLAVATSPTARPRYVPAEQVGTIVEGTVTLTIDPTTFAGLPEYGEPPESAHIEGEGASFVQRSEAHVVQTPVQAEQVPFTRRVLLWFGRIGRR